MNKQLSIMFNLLHRIALLPQKAY